MFTNFHSYKWRRDWVLRNQSNHPSPANIADLTPIFSAARYVEGTLLEQSDMGDFFEKRDIKVDEAVRTTFDSYIAAIGEPNWDKKYQNILATNIEHRTWQQSAAYFRTLFLLKIASVYSTCNTIIRTLRMSISRTTKTGKNVSKMWSSCR